MSFDERPFDLSLLRTAFVPDELESKPIKAAIAAQREAIEAIDSQISDLEQRIVDLRMNRQDISENMAFNQAFLAPMRRVAPEILCQIFGHSSPPEPTQNTLFPLSLIGVCHTWRQMVQERPPLWAQIYVDSRTHLSLVEIFLRNSANIPLDVTLALGDHISENATEASDDGNIPWEAMDEDQAAMVMETKKIVRLISEQHGRIRRLSLHAPYSILKAFFPSRFRMKTSLLEDLNVNCPDTPRIESRFRLKGGRLRTLKIDGIIFFTTSINRTFNLRRISLHGPVPLSKLLQFLRVSPALEELKMEDFRSCNHDQPPDVNDLDLQPIFLTKLSLFEIYWSAHYYGSIRQSPIRYIRTPAVKILFFKFDHYTEDLDDLYNLITSSAKSVSRLSLEGLKCPCYQFFRMIRGLSALEVLSLTDLRVKGIWEILTPEEDAIPNVWVCPKLTTLKLHEVDVDETFLEFVRRRTKPIQGGSIHNGFNYLGSVLISEQYLSPDVSIPLGILESEREDFFLELRDCHD